MTDSFVISQPVPFPNLLHCAALAQYGRLIYDQEILLQKAGFHNRYQIATAQGAFTFSIPLKHGREQRRPIREVQISDRDNWQQLHWRTITSAYNRAPFFHHYEPELHALFFSSPWQSLSAFNESTSKWTFRQLKLPITMTQHAHEPESVQAALYDLRFIRPSKLQFDRDEFPKYSQVFEDRIGFLPNLSALDLLFMEGPFAAVWVSTYKEAILNQAGRLVGIS